MAQQAIDTKLSEFEQAIRLRAEAERDKIILETEAARSAALEQEENRLLEAFYHKLQQDTARVNTANVREISREKARLKKELYHLREQCLDELLEQAAARLRAFADSPDYEAYLLRQIKTLARDFAMPDSVIRVRPADMRFAEHIVALYGPCEVVPDGSEMIGGVVLTNTVRGIEADLTLDTALAAQREWFYNHSNFHFE